MAATNAEAWDSKSVLLLRSSSTTNARLRKQGATAWGLRQSLKPRQRAGDSEDHQITPQKRVSSQHHSDLVGKTKQRICV